ncbi:MAG: HNH endonuclease [Syntrophorhabdaceae bacterium]|nr:HNH endonuclease [Syntrophorhabdaceae bacterium]
MLNSSVLVLNRAFFPVHITSVRRAFCLLYAGLAKAINEQYELFDYPSWSVLSASEGDGRVGLVGRSIRIPRVLVLVAYDRVPRRAIRFSRRNVFIRDGNTCQYCGRAFPSSELNLDHVIPRSRGGKTSWENIVCSCLPCNKTKGGNPPEQAGMRLISRPAAPRWSPEYAFSFRGQIHKEWMPFLNVVDFTYWNLELRN